MGRFICSDVVTSTGQGLLGNNMFAYCANNPVSHADNSGHAVETVLDLISLGASIADVASNPSDVWAWAGLAGDLVDVLLPFFGGAGETIRIAKAAAEVADTVDDLHDTAKVVDKVSDSQELLNDIMKNGACFVAGTLVYTADGNKPIEQVQENDLVWAWDESTGDVSLKRVVETYVKETSELIHVYVNGEEIVCTPTHPFYSPVKGWTEAVHLRAGDILVLVNGEYVVVEKVQHEILESPVTIYNFQVEDYHTYYVSNLCLLVHNSCYNPIREHDFRAVINPGELEAPHAHIFQKSNNIGRIFKSGDVDNSLSRHKDAMRFLRKHYDEIMELIDTFYGKR